MEKALLKANLRYVARNLAEFETWAKGSPESAMFHLSLAHGKVYAVANWTENPTPALDQYAHALQSDLELIRAEYLTAHRVTDPEVTVSTPEVTQVPPKSIRRKSPAFHVRRAVTRSRTVRELIGAVLLTLEF